MLVLCKGEKGNPKRGWSSVGTEFEAHNMLENCQDANKLYLKSIPV